MNNNTSIIDEALDNAKSGMEESLDRATKAYMSLTLDMPIKRRIETVKEVAHQINSYAFWLEQREFWINRQQFQHKVENMS